MGFAQGASNTNTSETTSEAKSKRVIFRATTEQIIQVQTMLREKGTYQDAADGKFNNDFRKAIKVFQGENGLKKTGTLNRATLEKMKIELTDQQQEIPVNPNSFASADGEKKPRKKAFRPTKAQITEAQEKLKSGGKFTGEIDGRYSVDLRSGLKDYQAENGLDKTGKLDEATLLKMGIELTNRQQGIETADSSDKPKRKVFRVNKDQIIEAQNKLKEAGLFSGEANGKYSPEFRDSIRQYQTANGLKRKGSLNRATLEKMKIELTESQLEIPVNPDDLAAAGAGDGKAKPKRNIFRATAEQIRRVQAMLREKGLFDGEETGKLDPATRSAIREWQSQNNVKKTGTLNKETLVAMKIELTEKQEEM
jgi:peptidoglycan hydrolase-like protein with peptidoglycan-binding domain